MSPLRNVDAMALDDADVDQHRSTDVVGDRLGAVRAALFGDFV